MENCGKLPIGIKPKHIVNQERAVGLIEAIYRFHKAGAPEYCLIKEWCQELIDIIDNPEGDLFLDTTDDLIIHMAAHGSAKADCIKEYMRLANVDAVTAKKRVEALCGSQFFE